MVVAISFEVPSNLGPESGINNLLDDFDFQLEKQDFDTLAASPSQPSKSRPGSTEKVSVLAARYAAGLPLWHMKDCSDHGPKESDLMGLSMD
jgi:hypothetical protein